MKNFVIPLIILPILLLISGPTQAIAQEPPPVLAFYYAWFDDNTWTSGQSAGSPAQPYRSSDPAVIERHVQQAQSAGINAFVQSWYGPQTEYNQTETNFRILLDTAARYNFQAGVDVEVMGPFFNSAGDVQSALATLMATHVNHPAYLRYQGQPVIFFWRQQRFSVDEWAAIRAAVDPNHSAYWIAEGLDLSYLDVFDGLHLYSIAWASSPQAELSKWPPRISAKEAILGTDKLWIATAMPGYNDLNLHRPDSFVRDRENGAYYRQTWQAAQATQPDMLIITSFNEWLEGTAIEPDSATGDFYLNLTRELVNGLSAPPTPPPPVPTATPIPTEAPNEDTPVETPAPQIKVGESYTVQAGDTLYAIAAKVGLSADTLIKYNNLSNPNRLSLGQILRLTPPEPMRPTRRFFLSAYSLPSEY